ncbi:MAG: hypothetical protein ABEJ23_06755 [Haloarculaceae archaeon]
MQLRRRKLVSLAAAAVGPALAGCSPCGETWTGVGYAVEPTAVERDGGWRVEAALSVDFEFGREGTGVVGPALALFDASGTVLDEQPVADATWSAVPESARESDDCGEYGSLPRTATLRSAAFPRWVGLRFDRYASSYPSPRTVSRYTGATPDGAVTSVDYESVPVDSFTDDENLAGPSAPVTDVQFWTSHRVCEPPAPSAEVNANVGLRADWGRRVPAPRYRPTLASVSLDESRLTVDVGLRTAPRLRRSECAVVPWGVSVDVDSPEDTPGSVTLRHRDPDGSVTDTATVAVEES